MFKDGVPSDDGLDEMQKKIANIQSVKNEYSHMELKLSQMTSLAKMADDEEEPEAPEKTKACTCRYCAYGYWSFGSSCCHGIQSE